VVSLSDILRTNVCLPSPVSPDPSDDDTCAIKAAFEWRHPTLPALPSLCRPDCPATKSSAIQRPLPFACKPAADLDHPRTSIQSSVLPPRLRAVEPRVVTVAPDADDRSPRWLRLVPDSPSRCGELLGELAAEDEEEELSWLAMLPLKGPLFWDSDSLPVEAPSVSGRFTTNTCFASTRQAQHASAHSRG
jgi:hypothetical protein